MKLRIDKYAINAFINFLDICQEKRFQLVPMSKEWIEKTLNEYYVYGWTRYLFGENIEIKNELFPDILIRLVDAEKTDKYRYATFNGQDPHMFSMYVFARDLEDGSDYAALFVKKGYVVDKDTGLIQFDPIAYGYDQQRRMNEKKDVNTEKICAAIENQNLFIQELRNKNAKKAVTSLNLILTIYVAVASFLIVKFDIFSRFLQIDMGSPSANRLASLVSVAATIFLFQKFYIPFASPPAAEIMTERDILMLPLPSDSDDES